MKTNIAFFLLFLGSLLSAQDSDSIKNRLSDVEKKIAIIPAFSFGKGVGITTLDSTFQMNMKFRMQNRIDANFEKGKDNSYEAMVRRARLTFEGFVFDPKFTYKLQFSFSSKDVGELDKDSDFNSIYDAMVAYKPTKNWEFIFGQTKLPGNRQRVNSSGSLQLTDRSINSGIYNIESDFGLQAHYLRRNVDKFAYNIKAAVSTGEGRNWTKSKDNGLAYTGRLELFPFGSFTKDTEYSEGDLLREPKPKLYFGGTYHYNQKAHKSGGQTGDVLFETKDMHSVLVDAMLKYRGWSFMSSYMNRISSDPLAFNPDNISDFNYVEVGNGFDVQASYLFPKNWEVIGRFSRNVPDDDIFKYTPKHNQYSVGLTKYIWKHTFKAQLEAGMNDYKYYDNSTKENFYVRFQVEIGI